MPDNSHGRLKIFLSFAEGVGKTYAMLDEAHRRKGRGQDVVVGLVDTKGRPATQEQLNGFEKLPIRQIRKGDWMTEELDTEAALKRHPDLVLVDELAHRNAAGSKHPTRWQDVQDLLDNGINVLATMNVQHLESLNDQIEDITGIHIEDTVPDQILHNAEEIEMVDVTVRALLNRLERGELLPAGNIDPQTAVFFSESNLAALREIALREAAGRVDEDVVELRREKKIQRPWQTKEKVMICVSPSNPSLRLIRRGWRLGQRMHADVIALYAEEGRLNEKQEKIISDDFSLAERLGIPIVKLRGNAAEEIVRYARDNNITQVMIGHSSRRGFGKVVRESIVTVLARELRTIDVHIVAAEQPKPVD